MNGLPSDFYEKICVVGCSSRYTDILHLFKELRHIAGNFGVFAQRMFDSCCYSHFYITRDSAKIDCIQKYSREDNEDLSDLSDIYVSWILIVFMDRNAVNVDRDGAERVRNIRQRDSRFCLQMDSPIVSEPWAEWLLTWKLHCLTITTELHDSAIELCKRIVERGTLTNMILPDGASDGRIVEMAKSALLHERFISLCFEGFGALKEILNFWRVNARRLSGKDVFFDGTYFVSMEHMNKGFGLCNEEDWMSIEKQYAYFPRTLFKAPSKPRCLNFEWRRSVNEKHNMFMFYDSVFDNDITMRIGLFFA
ncbi:hypothetical protein QR680_014833 [Steinernema hermaphroditum]|uniref:Uncharacterized protein n=1 Tax=Steinernema hermaphroditum TaxID=289476 RepID=A0AA39IA85_9BILA|nr:hypothetical protein QR680_014833 [Steinernema hermaphroditum]